MFGSFVFLIGVLLPAGLLLRDWKFSDRRTRKYRRMTKALFLGWALLGLLGICQHWRQRSEKQSLQEDLSELIAGKNELSADTSEVKERTAAITRETAQIMEMLRDELSIRNEQIAFLQGEVTRLRRITPSPRARELARQISGDASSYALALKAIAERRFDDARTLLDKA